MSGPALLIRPINLGLITWGFLKKKRSRPPHYGTIYKALKNSPSIRGHVKLTGDSDGKCAGERFREVWQPGDPVKLSTDDGWIRVCKFEGD